MLPRRFRAEINSLGWNAPKVVDNGIKRLGWGGSKVGDAFSNSFS